MRRCFFLIVVAFILTALLACNPAAPLPTTTTPPAETPNATAEGVPPELAYLGLNPVETSLPVYGGTLTTSAYYPRDFDGHQKAGYGPLTDLPCFNQLVIFDMAYKGISSKTIIGDLAESWEMNSDGTEITFKLHEGVKWHDGMLFTADDVVYSLEKMTDPQRSAISDSYPAYDGVEKIDDYTVLIRLKYPSAGFMMALAGPNSQIQAKHLAGTDSQSIDFMVGTGPFIITEAKTGIDTRWKRNPDYFKKDKYGNQLPYLDALYLVNVSSGIQGDDLFISRRLDVRNLVVAGSSLENFNTLRNGAPEALYQTTVKTDSIAFFINTTRKPLDDVRVRRALALVEEEENIIIGFSGDAMFGVTDTGLLHPSMGLPPAEIKSLMGWDQPFEDRVAEAKRLLAEAGYPDGFKLEIMAQRASTVGGASTATGHPGASLVLADTFRRYLNIDAQVLGLSQIELDQRVKNNNYDINCQSFYVNDDPSQLATYFGSNGQAGWSKYANPELDTLMANLDRVIDPAQRQQDIWSIERTLLTDLPALPTGVFSTRNMFYYPHVKNLRFQTQQYSNICRLEDVWIDPALKPTDFATE